MRLSLDRKLDMRRRGCHHLTIMGKLTIIVDSYGASTKALESGGPAHTIPTEYMYGAQNLVVLFLIFFIIILFSSQRNNQQYVMVLLCHFSLTMTRSLSSVDRPDIYYWHDA